jgi:hypothetical protein
MVMDIDMEVVASSSLEMSAEVDTFELGPILMAMVIVMGKGKGKGKGKGSVLIKIVELHGRQL